jgi:hypothetical protein
MPRAAAALLRALLAAAAAAALAAATPADLGPAIAAGLRQCGSPCLRAGQGAPAEPSLAAAAWSYDDASGALTLTWTTAANASSLTLLAGHTFSGFVHAITGSEAAYSLARLAPLFTAAATDPATGDPVLDAGGAPTPAPGATSFPAAPGSVTLDALQTAALDNLDTPPDNVVIELTLHDAGGAPLPGFTIFSPLFAHSHAPALAVTSPSSLDGAMDAFPATVVATQTLIQVNWTASGAPWTQGFDIAFYGTSFNGAAIGVDADTLTPAPLELRYNSWTHRTHPLPPAWRSTSMATALAWPTR